MLPGRCPLPTVQTAPAPTATGPAPGRGPGPGGPVLTETGRPGRGAGRRRKGARQPPLPCSGKLGGA